MAGYADQCGCCMRFFVHYTPFDETFDPHELAADYGTGLLDGEGKPIATTPQVPGYALDPCLARYTTNPLNVATIGVQTLMPPVGLALLVAAGSRAHSAAMAELVPWRVRSAVVSVAHTLGMALLGGTTPLIGEWFLSTTGAPR